jgi:branched-chain amino acid aminotransferase
MRETVERANLKWGELPFAYVRTDAHIEYNYRDGKWDAGTVVEDDRITISIAATCVHYGQECFEGMKVFEMKDGRVCAFRPYENAKRMERTARKLMMVPLPLDTFVEAVERVVKLNRRFVPPHGSGAALYIRPLLIGTSGIIGVRPSDDYMFVVFTTPVGPYFKGGLAPIKLRVELEIDRAAPNGLGDAKSGANYAAGMRAGVPARREGYAEVIYLDAKEKKWLDETGASNVFGITRAGAYVTPDSPTILPSITNMSLEQCARDLGIPVERRPVHVDELPEFVEFGACGTAAVITPVGEIQYGKKTIRYGKPGEIGPVSKKLYERLTGIQTGEIVDPHEWTHEIAVD